MKRISLILFVGILLMANYSWAQTTEELQEMKTEKEATLAPLEAELAELQGRVEGLQAEVAGLTDQLTPYPRWSTGLLGNVGFSISNTKNWLLRATPNTSAVNIGLSATGFANGDYEKSFWRNSTTLNLGWLKFDDKDNSEDVDSFQVSSDAFNITSLYGYKVSDKWAISTLGEFRTSILEGRFNDPGYLDIGVGMTWTPISDLVVVIHPLNYNFIFSESDTDFASSLGTKIVADYTRQITKSIAWKSNLSAFMSYEGSDLSNWTWVNGFSTAVKGVGIGLDFGLRGNKQEAKAAGLSDNPLQSYWILGLSYAIASKK